MPKATVLLADGNTRSGLAVARSLFRRGIRVVLVADRPRGITASSRSVAHTVCAPNVLEDPEGFNEVLMKTASQQALDLVIPISDGALFALDSVRDEIAVHAPLAMPDSAAVRSVLDKRRNLEIALRVGVPCPRQFDLDSLQKIPELVQELGFPMILKAPGHTPDIVGSRLPFRVLEVQDESELRNHLGTIGSPTAPLFQEKAEGEVHNVCCFAIQGDVVAMHEYVSERRLSGSGVFRRIVELRSDLAEYSKSLLREIEWTGVAHLGFFIRPTDGKVWYMETNGRFWGSVQGSIDAGWDFPWWLHQYFVSRKRPSPGPIRLGSRSCWHRGDLEALARFFALKEPPTSWCRASRREAVRQYLHAFGRSIHSDVFRVHDPVPEILDHAELAAKLGRTLPRRSTKARP